MMVNIILAEHLHASVITALALSSKHVCRLLVVLLNSTSSTPEPKTNGTWSDVNVNCLELF